MEHIQDKIPQYKQLYQVLKDQIQHGVYQPGDFLPSEHALCKTFSVTRPTVRQALGNLVADGLIKKQKGKGSIVQAGKAGIGILSIKGTTASLPAGALKTKVVKKPEVMAWTRDFDFEISEAEAQAGCIRMSRLRFIGNMPVLYEITNLPNINLPRFCNRNFDNKSLFNTLFKYYNIEVVGGEQKIWALPASGEICELLKLDSGQPILHLQKRYETSRPHFNFYTSIWCNTGQYFLQGPF